MTKDHRDKGWAWVVVTGLAISSFILGGFLKAFGIFFAAFADKFNASASSTSLIVGVRAATFTVVAPLASVLCERFSVRSVLIGCGVLSSAGCMAAAFAPNMEVVILSTGVIAGGGMSAFFGPVQIAVGQYFNKRKTIGLSIAFSGMSLAQIVMSPVNVLLLEEFALRGTLILYSGILLNVVVAAMLVRPVEPHEDAPEVLPIPELSQNRKLSMASMQKLCQSSEMVVALSHENLRKVYSVEKVDVISSETDIDLFAKPIKTENGIHGVCAEVSNPVSTSGDSKPKNHQHPPKENLCRRIVLVISQVLDFSLFKNLRFTLYAVSQCLALIGYTVIPIYLFPRADDYNLEPRQSALILTIMGCTGFFSRILQGIFGDIERIGPKVIFMGGVLCFGLSALAVPFTSTFTEMAIASACVGVFGCTVIVVHTSNLINLVGVANLPKAVALTCFFDGLCNSLAPPLLGYIKDVTSSYDAVFFVLSATLLFSFSIMLIEPIVKCVQERRRGDKDVEKIPVE